jgi:UDP-N-acetylmuramoyl-tripeptide--D-alanyl-D-alanine ligase
MVELGKLQGIENRKFGESAAQIVDDFLVVGRTNRAALEMGARTGNARLLHMETRNEAVRWVRNTLVAGDAVLYENDLPDHYF